MEFKVPANTGDVFDIRKEGNYLLHHWNYTCPIYTNCMVK